MTTPGIPPWIEKVPSGWGLAPAFANLRQKRVPNSGMAETQVLSLSYGEVVRKRRGDDEGLVPESYESYQRAEPGDIVIRPTDLQNDRRSLRVGFVRENGIITSAYMCLQATGELDAEYAYLLLKAYDFKKVFYGFGSGLRQNLDFRHLKRLPLLIPPPETQIGVVAFVRDVEAVFKKYASINQELSVPTGRRGGGGGLVGEYRERLIVAAALGEIDVQNLEIVTSNLDSELTAA